jgi:hypothetical protein
MHDLPDKLQKKSSLWVALHFPCIAMVAYLIKPLFSSFKFNELILKGLHPQHRQVIWNFPKNSTYAYIARIKC